YVARTHAREGIGTLLMQRLIAECAGRGIRQMIARIGDSENAASIRLHQKLGFRRVGELSQVGFKFGRWWDVVEMQLLLEPRLQ
ncbi:MAG TPA: GNAT family N-acetyltransferase, partial [Bryobacteraceae bacterium]|nr:GNAT family N-acetyltransferase [Bryobacteraceae bacterium]